MKWVRLLETMQDLFNQPTGFIDQKYPNHVLKLTKAIHGLIQVRRAWYEGLSTF